MFVRAVIVDKHHPAPSEWPMFDIKQYGSGDKPSDSTERRNERDTDDDDIDLSDAEIPTASEPPPCVTASKGGRLAIAEDAHIHDADIQPDIPAIQDQSSSSINPTQPTTSPPSCVAPSPQPPPLVLATKPKQGAVTKTAGTQDSNPVPTIRVEDTHSDSFSTCSQLPTTHPSHLTAPVPQARANTSDLSGSPSPSVDDSSIPTLPETAGEPLWMRQKETLKYFRKVMKAGHLPTLISNWYRLEKFLGFPDQVCSTCVCDPHACSRSDRPRKNSRYRDARR